MQVGSLLKIPVSSRSKHENGMLSRRGIFAKRTQMLQLSRRIGQEASRWRKRFTASDADHLPAERVVNILRGGATCRPPRNNSVWLLFFFFQREISTEMSGIMRTFSIERKWSLSPPGGTYVSVVAWTWQVKVPISAVTDTVTWGGFVGPIVGSFNFWRVQHSS
jgi:hypothetical protein